MLSGHEWLCLLAAGGAGERADEYASPRTQVLYLTVHQKHLGIFFSPKIHVLTFSPLCPQTHSLPFSFWPVSKDPDFDDWVSQLPWQLDYGWILHGGGTSWRQKGRRGKRSGVSSPCLPCLGAVSLLKTESLVSGHGPLGQPILQGPSSHWLQ